MNEPVSGSSGGGTPGFVISSLLGHDGVLYAAQQLGLDRVVALKRLDAGQAADPAARARFQAEIGLAGELEHPGIVPIYQAGEDTDGVPFYALRRVHGRPWSIRLAEAGVRDDELDVLERVAEALAYAHDRGIAHGRLDPRVVILGDHGEVLLTGWDAASRDAAARQHDCACLAGLLARIWPEAVPPAAAAAGGFLAGLRSLRRAVQAARLGARARAHLAAARAGGGLAEWACARFACAEAERLDPSSARAGLVGEIATGYATAAAQQGDLDLALSVLDRADPAQAILVRNLEVGLRRRARRAAARRWLAVAVVALAALLGVVLTVTAVRSERGRRQARAAEAEAEIQRAHAAADAYASTLAAAADQLAGSRPDLARALLDAAPVAQRGWEWTRLQHLQAQRLPELDLGGADQTAPCAVDGGWIAARSGTDGIGLWRGAGSPVQVLRFPAIPRQVAIDPQGERLYADDAGELVCRHIGDGAERWRRKLDVEPHQLLVLADRRVIVLEHGGSRAGRWQSVDADGVVGGIAELPAGTGRAVRDGDGFLIAGSSDRAKRVVRLSGTPGQPAEELTKRDNAMIPALLGGIRPRLALVTYGNGACGAASLDGPWPSVWLGELKAVTRAVFSPDGLRFAGSGVDGLTLFVHVCASDRPPRRFHPVEPLQRLEFTADGAQLVLIGRNRIQLLPLEAPPTWREVAIDPGPPQPCASSGVGRSLRFPDGRIGDRQHAADITAVAARDGRVYSGDAAGWLAVWDPAHARRLWCERVGTAPIDAILPGSPLRLRAGGLVLELPGLAPVSR